MSYDYMDHAGWVERNIQAAQRGKQNAADKRRTSEGNGWFAAPTKLNAFQRRAFTILGIIGGGIYNAPIEWDSVHWGYSKALHVNWRSGLSTFDFQGLTTAVFLAHDAAIRLSIAPRMKWLWISLHERGPRTEGVSINDGHPDLHQAVAAHRSRFPVDHPIHWSAALEPSAEGDA